VGTVLFLQPTYLDRASFFGLDLQEYFLASPLGDKVGEVLVCAPVNDTIAEKGASASRQSNATIKDLKHKPSR
jgi:hypothetical protein